MTWLRTTFSAKFLYLLCLLLILGCPWYLRAQDQPTAELEKIKKINLSINKDNTILFSQLSLSQKISPRTYRKAISFPDEEFMISYGLNLKNRPTLFLQLKSSKHPHALLEISNTLISMSNGSSLTLTLEEIIENSTLTAGHYGYIRVENQRLEPGVSTPLQKKNRDPSDSLKTRDKIRPTEIETIPSINQPRTTAKSIERRKIQIETLREMERQRDLSKTKENPPTPSPSDPLPQVIQLQTHPETVLTLLRQNQILVQLTQGFQTIYDQFTNNPTSADDILKLSFPPLPPEKKQPPHSSTQEWIDQIRAENKTLKESTLTLKKNILQFLSSLPKPNFKLSPLIPDTIQDLTQSASQAYKKQNWDEAISQYQAALKIEPNSLHVLSNLGVVYFSKGNYELAQKTLQIAIQQAPHDAFSHSILGISAYQQDQLEDSMNHLFMSVFLNPLDPQAQNYLAMALTKKGWLKTAEEYARESIQLNPQSADTHYNLAQIYANQQPLSRELSKKHYLRSIDLGGGRDENLEKLLKLQISENTETPKIQINP